MTTTWKPKAWIAALLGLVLQFFTFLYVNKPKLFWLYLIPSLAVAFYDAIYGTFFSIVTYVVCAAHAFYICKRGAVVTERRWFSKWWGLLLCIALFFIVSSLVRAFLYEPYRMPAASMQPTLNVGDGILVSKLGYRTYTSFGVTLLNDNIASPDLMQPGKLYVFQSPQTNVAFVKRLIAVPGDTIAIVNDGVIINGIELQMTLVDESNQTSVYEETLGKHSYKIQLNNEIKTRDFAQTTVPENSYFFLGDNRDNSSDSRFWGFVGSDKILGEVVIYPSKPKAAAL